MSDERIIEKIKKCLALAGNNSNQEEATAAALQAQKLMAKYNVELAEINDELIKEEIQIERVEVGTGLAWKFHLASIIADNFKCKTFSYGRRTIAFYGHSTDSVIAKEVFSFLLKLGHKLGLKERAKFKNLTGKGDGVYNSFVMGFMSGVKEKLEVQSTALMIVIPQDVKEEFQAFTSGMKTINTGCTVDRMNRRAYENGRTEGRQAMSSREIESK